MALDLGGNCLFHYSPHPFNEHLRNYFQDFTTILVRSKITHIDLSDNSIAGQSGRELKSLLEFVNKFILTRAQSFVCRSNNLNSQSFKVISNGLGIHSTLTYLDLSDNFGGMDPRRVVNSEGIESICNLLAQSLNMNVLKVARNYLSDEDISMIFTAVQSMPRMKVVDVSGNLCTLRLAADSMIQAVNCHSSFDSKADLGIREIDISNNFLLDGKAAVLAQSISKTASLTKMNLSQCSLSDKAISSLASGLVDNSSIIDFNIFANPEVSRKTGTLFQAEIEANILLSTITDDPLAVDCNQLSNAVYNALHRKLKFLSKETLIALYSNDSFTIASTDMFTALQMNQAQPRDKLLKVVKKNNVKIDDRLQQSGEVARRMAASRKIFHAVMFWYKPIRDGRRLRKVLEEVRKREAMLNSKNFQDDLFKY